MGSRTRPTYTIEWRSNTKMKKNKSRAYREWKCKENVFMYVFVKSRSIYIKSILKWWPILHISWNTFHQRKCIIFELFVFWKSFFAYPVAQNGVSLFNLALAYRAAYPIARLPKLRVVAETFLLDGAKVFYTGLFKSSFNLGCKSHLVGVSATL